MSIVNAYNSAVAKTILSLATPGEWSVGRVRSSNTGETIDAWVVAPDVNGFAYQAEILGDDEYRDSPGDDRSGITRRIADAELIVRAVKEYRERYGI